MGGNFPLRIKSVRRKEKPKKKKEEEKKKDSHACEEEKESGVRSSTLSLRSTEIRPSVFVGARCKVHLRDESFTYVREYEVFAKLQKVENFPTRVISSLKVI